MQPPEPNRRRGQAWDWHDSCAWERNEQEWGPAPTEWKLRRLSTLAQSLGHARIDLVKLDCEGIENHPRFIEDMLALRPQQVILEQHPTEADVGAIDFKTQNAVSFAQWRRVQNQLKDSGYYAVWHGRTFPGIIEVTWAHRDLVTLNHSLMTSSPPNKYIWQERQLERKKKAQST